MDAFGNKTGGRKKGTPNKVSSDIKTILKQHSLRYYTEQDEQGLTAFERDLAELTPENRVNAENKILNKTVADLKAVDANIVNTQVTLSIEDKLREYLLEDEI